MFDTHEHYNTVSDSDRNLRSASESKEDNEARWTARDIFSLVNKAR